jgi:outer membrane protein OmpA-like peptidoglycan-associated protein
VKLKNTKTFYTLILTALTLTMLLGGFSAVLAVSEPTRILILPIYNEDGLDTEYGSQDTKHYRRMVGLINNQLVRYSFGVVDFFAGGASAEEYNLMQERARVNASLVSLEMCEKYKTDVAYIVWLTVKVRKVIDGGCEAVSRFDVEGYDSEGRDLGAAFAGELNAARGDCGDAVAEVENKVGSHVGQKLAVWSDGVLRSSQPSNASSVVVGQPSENLGGILVGNSRKYENLVTIRLDGATGQEVVEAFGKVVNTVRGVIAAKFYHSGMTPDNPQSSSVNWRVNIQDTDVFRLQSNILKMLHDISDSGGNITLEGVPYRYTAAEIDLLKGIRPGSASSGEIQFVMDQEMARDRDFSGRHDAASAADYQFVDTSEGIISELTEKDDFGLSRSVFVAEAPTRAIKVRVKEQGQELEKEILVNDTAMAGVARLKVEFDVASAKLRRKSYDVLDQLGIAIGDVRLAGQQICIKGHTDSDGDDDYNRRLSYRRAEAVRDYVVRQHDLKGTDLFVVGYGEQMPIADNSTPAGKQMNRRVEISLGCSEIH